MAKSVNKVILVGNVGQDPEVKYTASGVPVAKVSLATNERFKLSYYQTISLCPCVSVAH